MQSLLLAQLLTLSTCLALAGAPTPGTPVSGDGKRHLSMRGSDRPDRFYLSLNTGFNNYAGILGTTLEYSLFRKFSILGGIGLGGWGIKSTLGVRYYREFPFGWGFGTYITGSTGIKNAKLKLESVDDLGRTETQKLSLDLNAASTFNLSFFYQWKLGKASRFSLEAGYAIPLQKSPYVLKENYELTEKSLQIMNTLQPGGLILALGFSFPL